MVLESIRSSGTAASGVLIALVMACSSTGRAVPPAPAPPPAVPPRDRPAPTPSPDRVDSAPVERAEPASKSVEALPWVNPARCLRPCTYGPEPSLVQVDDHGAPDPVGRHRVAAAIQREIAGLVAAAHAAGHHVRIESAFRPYNEQALLFRRTKQIGRAARPGHSEHQLGTAVDLRMPTKAAMTWLAEHAHEHGFALSYPDGKQRITGYRPEPWHVRFVGPMLAAELHDRGWTLEELFRSQPDLGVSGDCQDCPLPASRTACGTVTVAGRCKRTVLEWCYDGALAAVDCAAFQHSCGRDRAGDHYDCLPPPDHAKPSRADP
ncbi:MAG: D-alanyl-D-alanine carboxypeptidase family protein [Kofleriaceae bacterium]